jgi:hypothetical protein
LAQKAFGRLTDGIEFRNLFRDHWTKSGYYQAFLEAVIEVTDGIRTRTSFDSDLPDRSGLPNLSALLVGMGFWESPVTDIYVLAERQGEPALREIVRGAISALNLNASNLKEETKSALLHIKLFGDVGLFEIVWKIPTDPDWAKPIALNLNPVKVTDGLFHPSLPVRFTAAQLLSAGVGAEEGKSLVREALYDDRCQESTLQIIALLAPDLWEPSETAEILIDRLNGPQSPGFGYLYEALAEIAARCGSSVAVTCGA